MAKKKNETKIQRKLHGNKRNSASMRARYRIPFFARGEPNTHRVAAFQLLIAAGFWIRPCTGRQRYQLSERRAHPRHRHIKRSPVHKQLLLNARRLSLPVTFPLIICFHCYSGGVFFPHVHLGARMKSTAALQTAAQRDVGRCGGGEGGLLGDCGLSDGNVRICI